MAQIPSIGSCEASRMNVFEKGKAVLNRAGQKLFNETDEESGLRIIPVETREDCAAVFAQDFAILFKYSTQCGLSDDVYDLVKDFYKDKADRVVYTIAVPDARPAAVLVEQHTGVTHETPQLLAMRKGEVFTHASHRKINWAYLEQLP
jgi:bacillithiol system protein YtxJ